MTGGQVLLTLAFLASAGLSGLLIAIVARQDRTIESMRESVDRLADQAATSTAGPEPTTLAPFPVTATDLPRQPSVVTAVLGVPLLKLAALSFGLRRALDPDHRRHLSRVVDAELRAARRRRRTTAMGRRRMSVGAR